MTPIIESTATTIGFTNDTPYFNQKITKIYSGKPTIMFTCQHCKSVFETNTWYRTKGRNYGVSCPCCHYAAWKSR